MKCDNLLKNLDTLITKKLLKPDNCTSFYLDAIRFANKTIAEACENLLQQNMEKILEQEEGTKFLLNLPFTYMKSICSSNKLTIKDEKALVGLFEKYLAHRDSLPLLKEEDPSQDWTHLTQEEKDARTKAQEEKKAEEAKAKEDAEKASQDAYNALDDLGKANADWAKKVEIVHNEAAERLKI